MLVDSGFLRWTLAAQLLGSVPGWSLGRCECGHLSLYDPDQLQVTHTDTVPDPRWVSAAASQSSALFAYGRSGRGG